MNSRIRVLGALVALAGLVMSVVGYTVGTTQAYDGLDSAQAMYEAQGVTVSYNEDGQLVDRGTVEGAEGILHLLEDVWDYPLNYANMDPSDPLVNTRDELMWQFAVISYHVLHGTRPVELTAEDVPITYNGVTYDEPGTYDIAVGKNYAQLNRGNPIEAQLRDAWDGRALALLAQLSSGHANQAAGEIAAAFAWFVIAMGGAFFVLGAGLFWAGSKE